MLAVTEALALMVNVQVFVLLLPLEQAPDHTTSRPLDTLNVTEVPLANDAVPLVPVTCRRGDDRFAAAAGSRHGQRHVLSRRRWRWRRRRCCRVDRRCLRHRGAVVRGRDGNGCRRRNAGGRASMTLPFSTRNSASSHG